MRQSQKGPLPMSFFLQNMFSSKARRQILTVGGNKEDKGRGKKISKKMVQGQCRLFQVSSFLNQKK